MKWTGRTARQMEQSRIDSQRDDRIRLIVREEIERYFKPTESQKKALKAFHTIASLEISEREPSASPERLIAYLQSQADRSVGKQVPQSSEA